MLQVGEGRVTNFDIGFMVPLLDSVTCSTSICSLCDRTSEGMKYHYKEEWWLSSRAVMTTRNIYITTINNIFRASIPGPLKTLTSTYKV